MTPPQRLRHKLEALRRRGYSFRQAWPVAVSRAVSDLPVREQVFWRRTWNREQRQAWAVSYSRVPWPVKRTRLFSPDVEHGHRGRHALVA